MSPPTPDSEAALETATLALFEERGWQTLDAYHETYGEAQAGAGPYLGRATRSDVILRPRLMEALERLNPGLPAEAYEAAHEDLARDRSAMTLAAANRDIHDLLHDGLLVTYRGPEGDELDDRLRLIDWDEPGNNDWLLVQQLWVAGEAYTRRPDLVGFVNGLPLLFGELKAHHVDVEAAYRHNLKDYKDTIPHLLWYSAFMLLSNGSDARLGTVTSEWEHFAPWKKINHEGEEGVISLETAVRATCSRERFLDLVENYLIFQDRRGGPAKILAKYHQYLGVEAALEAVGEIRENQGRLGVFWHTQGSGKSISMVFFCQKVLRQVPGNWTFLVITDRLDLDDQIYKNFSRAGAVTEPETTVRAQSGEHLKQLLGEDHRYIFTLIQKFGTERGKRYPKISDRSDIIVITDEAHRSQYDILAMNMRDALPNAAFLAFTATPLIVGEERTREVFGEYVSVYSYKDSNKDRATVPLYYENRIPELQIANQDLNDQIYERLEEAELDDAQEAALAREFARDYHLITRADRLGRVAEDIVDHFINRGHMGKAMVVSIDKLTAVRMYDLVQARWEQMKERLKIEIPAAKGDERDALLDKLAYMMETDMAVVISGEQGEVEKFRARGMDIVPHRLRIKTEALDEKFKDPDDPFRLVFVCAMWRTGFDVPCCSTIYLDRPMRNHTLMQTIARANRVFGAKVNGLIVDYFGIFRHLQRALAIYGTGPGGLMETGEEPVQDKAALIGLLRDAVADAESFLAAQGIALGPILEADTFQRVALMDDAVEAIIVDDDHKSQFLALAGTVDQLFKAVLPDTRAGEFGPRRHALVVLAAKIRSLTQPADISDVLPGVEEVLDASIKAQQYRILETGGTFDLSQVNFRALKEQFEKGRKRTEAEKLRRTLNARLRHMVRLNKSRLDYLEVFQGLIDEYNNGSKNVEELFNALVAFAQELAEETQRAVAEGLSEEELAVFDLITRPDPGFTDWEKRQIKRVAREMLDTLKARKLVLDWRKRQQTRAAVRVTVQDWVWQLPECFTEAQCQAKSGLVYQHMYDNYWGAWSDRQSTYAAAGAGV